MVSDLQELSRSLSEVNSRYGRLVVDRMTTVDTVPAPFSVYRICRVEYLGPHHPELFYVAYAPGRPVHLLSEDTDTFNKLVAEDRVVIDSAERAEQYAAVFIEVTRSMSQLTYLVRSVDEVRFRPKLSPEEEARKSDFLNRYRSLIHPPKAAPAGSDWEVVAWVVRQQALQRHTLRISRSGAVARRIETVEEDLPLVYGL